MTRPRFRGGAGYASWAWYLYAATPGAPIYRVHMDESGRANGFRVSA